MTILEILLVTAVCVLLVLCLTLFYKLRKANKKLKKELTNAQVLYGARSHFLPINGKKKKRLK